MTHLMTRLRDRRQIARAMRDLLAAVEPPSRFDRLDWDRRVTS